MTLETYFNSWFLLHFILIGLIGFLLGKLFEVGSKKIK